MFITSVVLKDLQRIPGVGKKVSRYLCDIGICSVKELKGKNPEKLYENSNRLVGYKQDRCLLYVFRCAVFFAENEKKNPNPEKIKWWNWKD